MAIRMEGSEAHLVGDWTESGITENLDSLMFFLEESEARGSRQLCIDCQRIDGADTGCLQLLNVWMMCAKLRGIEPKLVHVNDGMQQAMQKSGFTSFTESFTGKS